MKATQVPEDTLDSTENSHVDKTHWKRQRTAMWTRHTENDREQPCGQETQCVGR